MKYCLLLYFPAIVFTGCNSNQKKQSAEDGIQKFAPPRIIPEKDTPLVKNPAERTAPKDKRIVVGYQELGIYFYNWPANFKLNFAGAPLSQDNYTGPIQIKIYNDVREHILTLRAELWTHVRSPAIGDSKFHVGKFNASRSIDPTGNLEYTFETDLIIVNVSDLKPAYENWFIANFSDEFDEATDSLISLAWSPFPLQIPQEVQKIGISFPTQSYQADGFQHTKMWVSLTNFFSHEVNTQLIADVTGSIVNLTDGKPTLKAGEEFVLKNFYAGLSTRWALVHEGDQLTIYESIRDETTPAMDSNTTTDKKTILVLPLPEELKFSFHGYAPMGE